MKLGKVRRALGQKSGDWTDEMNERLLGKTDKNGDGAMTSEEFSEFFELSLPYGATEFDRAVQKFMLVAETCREHKKQNGSCKSAPVPTSPMQRTSRKQSSKADGSKEQAAEKERAAERAYLASLRQKTEKRLSSPKRQRPESIKKTPTKEEAAAQRAANVQLRSRLFRERSLRAVFQKFDLDNDGVIHISELLDLGKARRKLGQKEGMWTEDKNQRFLKRLDQNQDGVISMAEFVLHFEEALPHEEADFLAVISQFMECARMASSTFEMKIRRGEETPQPRCSNEDRRRGAH